jgi:hypothetical protein
MGGDKLRPYRKRWRPRRNKPRPAYAGTTRFLGSEGTRPRDADGVRKEPPLQETSAREITTRKAEMYGRPPSGAKAPFAFGSVCRS